MRIRDYLYNRRSIKIGELMRDWSIRNSRYIVGFENHFYNVRRGLEVDAGEILKKTENNKKKIIWRRIK